VQTYRELIVWRKSIKFVSRVYCSTIKFPEYEKYGLTNQLRRSSISIPSNIAEGFGRRADKEFIRYLQIAMGSLFELQTQLQIAFQLRYLNLEIFKKLFKDSREIERMLRRLIEKISQNVRK
jgi:four helix bundle protein